MSFKVESPCSDPRLRLGSGALGGAVGPLIFPWCAARGGVPLVILPPPNRSFLAPCLAYIGEIREKDPDGWLTVLLAEVIPAPWWQNHLYNHRALIYDASYYLRPNQSHECLPFAWWNAPRWIWLGSGSLRLRF